MKKAIGEKSIRITPKPKKSSGIPVSFVEGAKQSKIPKPKSLTPLKGKR